MIPFQRFLLAVFVAVPFLLLISLSIDSSQISEYPSSEQIQHCSILEHEIRQLKRRIVELEAQISGKNNAKKALSRAINTRKADDSVTMGKKKVAKFVHTTLNNGRSFRSGQKKSILITGGAGFVGSHLLDRLIADGHKVIVVDNFYTGQRRNIEHWLGHPNFLLIEHDIVNPLYIDGIDQIYHLASPASPPHYMRNPVKTIKINSVGTQNMLGLAKRLKARILVASTSEVYGDPEVHPQSESYWGNVNPIGPRSCYDEGKRVAEALTYAYEKQSQLDVRVARIFNTYGPRMHAQDGRVVSNFISQALQGLPLTVYGGEQTRSFQYISDLVSGLIALMENNYTLPVNIGNPEEYSINELAAMVLELVHGNSNRKNGTVANDVFMTDSIIYSESPEDDPRRRRPNITLAKQILNWSPQVSAREGLRKTIEYFIDEFRNNNSNL